MTRSDLPYGFTAAQIAHAAGFSVIDPLPINTNVVILDAGNQERLEALRNKLSAAGIAHIPIIEADEPFTGQLTAIGLIPTADRVRIRKHVADLPLLCAGATKALQE